MSIDTKFIGKTYPTYTYEVGKEKIKEYAKAIKNLDPYYLDDDFAKKSKYGAIIAPPTFAVVFGAYLIEPVFTDKDLNLNMAMLVHGEQELEFLEVVKAGDIVLAGSFTRPMWVEQGDTILADYGPLGTISCRFI